MHFHTAFNEPEPQLMDFGQLISVPIDRLIAIAAIIVTVYVALRQRTIKRLDVTQTVNRLQSRKHPDIRIYFREHEVANLSRARILFSNTGTVALKPTADFSSQFSQGLVIAAVDQSTRILSAALLGGDLIHSGASIVSEADGKFARLQFEYLNPGQRIAVEILFTGAPPVAQFGLVGGLTRSRTINTLFEITDDIDFFFGMASMVATFFVPNMFGLEAKDIGLKLVLFAVAAFAAGFTLAKLWRRRRRKRSGRVFLDSDFVVPG
jgi:hypothetical protein